MAAARHRPAAQLAYGLQWRRPRLGAPASCLHSRPAARPLHLRGRGPAAAGGRAPCAAAAGPGRGPPTCISARLLFHSWMRPSASRRSTTATFHPRSCSASAGSSPSVPPHTTTSNAAPSAAAGGAGGAALLAAGSGGGPRGAGSWVTTAGPFFEGSCFCCRRACVGVVASATVSGRALVWNDVTWFCLAAARRCSAMQPAMQLFVLPPGRRSARPQPP
jgi:hypothetical protein